MDQDKFNSGFRIVGKDQSPVDFRNMTESTAHEITTPQRIMGEAIEHLQGRQKEVYYLIMREKMSELEVAELMGITQQAVNTYKMRAIKFITAYCQNAITKGEKE